MSKEDSMSTHDDRLPEAPSDRGSQRAQLTLPRAAVARRVDALFKAMASDFLLREQFVTDPAQILAEYVHGARLSPEKASVNNLLLYSVVSNPALLHWIGEYSTKHHQELPTRQTFVRDFARAATERGDFHVVIALARGSLARETVLDVDDLLFQIFFHGPGIFGPAAETGGAEGGPGHTGGSDGGTGTGTGTEQSGTGTEHSLVGSELFGSYVAVTLDALAHYAIGLRSAGALDVI
jgi:hypothetical protein